MLLGFSSDQKRQSKPETGVQEKKTFDIYDHPLARSRKDISLSFFSFLFAETVKYSLSQVSQSQELEDRLHVLGLRVGTRVLELYSYKDKVGRRETRLLNILSFISQTCWKQLFGHNADLLKGQDQENEYMITDRNLLLTKFISAPRDIEHVSCASYAAGIVEAILCSAEFPAEVTAHNVEDGTRGMNTTILIRFLPEVIAREKKLAG